MILRKGHWRPHNYVRGEQAAGFGTCRNRTEWPGSGEELTFRARETVCRSTRRALPTLGPMRGLGPKAGARTASPEADYARAVQLEEPQAVSDKSMKLGAPLEAVSAIPSAKERGQRTGLVGRKRTKASPRFQPVGFPSTVLTSASVMSTRGRWLKGSFFASQHPKLTFGPRRSTLLAEYAAFP